jgi:hypothetical protein
VPRAWLQVSLHAQISVRAVDHLILRWIRDRAILTLIGRAGPLPDDIVQARLRHPLNLQRACQLVELRQIGLPVGGRQGVEHLGLSLDVGLRIAVEFVHLRAGQLSLLRVAGFQFVGLT